MQIRRRSDMSGFVESHVEEAALEWFGELGYEVRNGPDISPGGARRSDFSYPCARRPASRDARPLHPVPNSRYLCITTATMEQYA
jgi:hypothetical protein